MKNPVHPGIIVRKDCMKPLNLSVTECARVLGVARQTLSNLVNAKASVSVEMAYRLSKAFGSTPRTWLGMQLAFDLARSQEPEEKIRGKARFRYSVDQE
jgi:addiction module HigA family antidote